MRAYWAIFSARFRLLLQYRAAAAAGVGTQIFWGLIRMMIFGAFYAQSAGPQPMDWPQVLTYVWLGQAMIMTLPWSADGELQGLIRSGNVAYELVRPLDLYAAWYARAVAMRTATPLLRAVPIFILGMLLFGMRPPASAAAGLAWGAATVAAVLLSAAITMIYSIAMIWTVAGDGLRALMGGAVWILSGMVVPLPLFPDWAQRILSVLPFRGIMDVPFRLYVGNIPPAQVWGLLAQQLAWTAALVLLGRTLLAVGKRRIVVQGG